MGMSQGGNDHRDGTTMSGGDGGGMGYPPKVMMMMQMSFYWGKEAVVLFSGLPGEKFWMYELYLLFSGLPGEKFWMYELYLLFIIFLAAALEILYFTPNGKPEAASTI